MIAKITTVYGVKGWVKVHSFTEPMSNFLNYSGAEAALQFGKGNAWKPIVLDEVRLHGKGIVAHIAGVDDREIARTYCGLDLSIDQDELPALDGDEYYWHQLQGLEVYSVFGGAEQLLGKVDHLIETGANDVLVVKPSKGSIDQRERLLPYVPETFVLSIDEAAGRMEVDWDPEF
ncbi:ribosome maturation factor RimM [Spongiibacter pelagi]|uniref:ribosome maturation factor RimM n=1 Tax=Spongiibacter pelagi TaxID=2760804 RepID=UPI00295B1666|nr:ribosome maturation factor RimM [Spongiibacter pelagi]